MKQVKKELKTIAGQLEKLRKKTEEMTDRVSELTKKRGAPKRKDVATPTVMDQVIRVMKRHRGGVTVATLMTETGFGPTKIRNTLNRAHKQGKISRIQRGLYVAL